MVPHAERLRDFITDVDLPIGNVVEVLCEDHVGTYRPQFLCRSTPEGLRSEGTGELIEVRAIGAGESQRTGLEKAAASSLLHGDRPPAGRCCMISA